MTAQLNQAFASDDGVVTGRWDPEGTTVSEDFIAEDGRRAHEAGGQPFESSAENVVDVPWGEGSPLAPSKVQVLPSPRGYPDVVAQSYTLSQAPEKWLKQSHPHNVIVNCPAYAVVGYCRFGHYYAKLLICGREWCPHCGGLDGLAHHRRMALWFPRLVQLTQLGYMVITLPMSSRNAVRSRSALSVLGSKFRRMMKSHGIGRGLRRWHWFGDPHEDQDTPFDVPPTAQPFHPHINLLCDTRWLDEDHLIALKLSVSRILEIRISDVNLHYSYASTPAQMVHKMRYVLRPTFSDSSWDLHMAETIIGLRNSLSWGRWGGPPRWAPLDTHGIIPSQELQLIHNGRCPEDHSVIKWTNVLPSYWIGNPEWRDLEGGYFKLHDYRIAGKLWRKLITDPWQPVSGARLVSSYFTRADSDKLSSPRGPNLIPDPLPSRPQSLGLETQSTLFGN